MIQKNTMADESARKNCNHKRVVSIEEIVENKAILTRLFRGGVIASEKWNLEDKPAAYLMLHGDDVYCPKCETWGRYSASGGGFIFPPHGYRVE